MSLEGQDPREQIQQEAKEAWLDSAKKNTIIVPTGAGKSKIAIDILKEFYVEDFENVLLLTNSTDLRDNNWKAEFDKWGYKWDSIQSDCYQTAYRWKGKTFDLVIADEIDFVGEEYAKFFSNNECGMILGLTGFVTEDKAAFINTFAPIVFKANVEDLQEQNILNKSEFILVEYPLSLQKNIEQKTKTGAKFYVSENDQYKYWDGKFRQAVITKTQIEKKYKILMQPFEHLKEWQTADWNFKITASKRKKLLHTLESTIEVTKNILEKIHKEPGNKVLIFNTLTQQADRLPNPFHGKTEEDISGIERLNKGEIDTLSVVKKVTRGVNLVGVNYLIRATYDGSETDLSQSLGRLMRLKVNQTAKYIILLPTYTDITKTPKAGTVTTRVETQATKWKDKMIQSLENPTIKTIRLSSTYKINEEVEI